MSRLLISIFIVLMGNSAFAAGELGSEKTYDKYTGIYRSADKKVTLLVAKVLVKEGDLLNEPQYEYQLKLIDRDNSFADTEFSLEPDENGALAGGSIDGECDDPGCYDVDYEIDISEEGGTAAINLNVEWYRYPDGDEDEDSGYFEVKAVRAFTGIESPLAEKEALSSAALRDLVYDSAKYHVRWISSNGDYRIAATKEESQFSVYKKIFTAEGGLEGLFVRIDTKSQSPRGVVSPAHCHTLLLKKQSWKAVYTDCNVLPF